VPNSSFEEYTNCSGASGNITDAKGWFSSSGSPDYYNPCAGTIAPTVDVPSNWCGYQLPLDGNAYAGIGTKLDFPPNTREIISTSLEEPLIIGEKYFVSAYVSRGLSEITHCAVNNFGFRFSINSYVAVNQNHIPIDNFSHIHSTSLITDTANWVWLGGSFVADSAYQYLMLGNFYDDENTDTVDCINLPNYGKIAYYYIDKVCVSTDSLENLSTNIIEVENGVERFSIYPNPARSILHIKNIEYTQPYILLNSLGQRVDKGELTKGLNLIDVSSYDRGIYFLLINNSATKILFIN